MGPGSLFGAVRGGLSTTDETAGDWAVGSLGGRWLFPLGGGIAVGATVSGQAFRVDPPTFFEAVTGRLQPELRWSSSRVSLSVRGEGSLSRTESQTRTSTGGGGGVPGLPGPTDPEPTATRVTTDLSQLGGEARLAVEAGPASIWLRGEAVDGDLGTYEAGGVGASLSTGPFHWNARVAYWNTPTDEEVVGGLRLSVPFGGGWSASGEGRRRAPDPLLGTPASADLAATLRKEFTFTVDAPRPLYEFGRETADGRRMVDFRLRRPDADSVAVVGDFSDWEPVPMERSDGTWRASIPVAPGLYHFGFRVDGEWVVPARASGVVSDDWGRQNATVVVPGSDSDG